MSRAIAEAIREQMITATIFASCIFAWLHVTFKRRNVYSRFHGRYSVRNECKGHMRKFLLPPLQSLPKTQGMLSHVDDSNENSAAPLSEVPSGISPYSSSKVNITPELMSMVIQAMKRAQNNGVRLMEVEFPPLAGTKNPLEDFSNIDVLDANRDFAMLLTSAIIDDTQLGRDVASNNSIWIVFGDANEAKLAAQAWPGRKYSRARMTSIAEARALLRGSLGEKPGLAGTWLGAIFGQGPAPGSVSSELVQDENSGGQKALHNEEPPVVQVVVQPGDGGPMEVSYDSPHHTLIRSLSYVSYQSLGTLPMVSLLWAGNVVHEGQGRMRTSSLQSPPPTAHRSRMRRQDWMNLEQLEEKDSIMLVVNGAFDKLRSGYYPPLLFPRLAEVSDRFIRRFEPVYFLKSVLDKGVYGWIHRVYPEPWQVIWQPPGANSDPILVYTSNERPSFAEASASIVARARQGHGSKV